MRGGGWLWHFNQLSAAFDSSLDAHDRSEPINRRPYREATDGNTTVIDSFTYGGAIAAFQVEGAHDVWFGEDSLSDRFLASVD